MTASFYSVISLYGTWVDRLRLVGPQDIDYTTGMDSTLWADEAIKAAFIQNSQSRKMWSSADTLVGDYTVFGDGNILETDRFRKEGKLYQIIGEAVREGRYFMVEVRHVES